MREFGAEAEGPRVRDFVPSPAAPATGILHAMYLNGTTLEQLSRDECLRLVGSVPLGRIVYTRQAPPGVELVSFALADGDIVIRTDSAAGDRARGAGVPRGPRTGAGDQEGTKVPPRGGRPTLPAARPDSCDER
jgi:hypothetical protein